MSAVAQHAVPYPTEAIQMVTPKMASFWLDNCPYIHQRKIRSYHVSSLSRMMEDGRFRQKTQVNFCRLKGRFYLTNGQHTLKAVVQSGVPQLLSVIVTDVNSMGEVADDFSRHDTHLTRQHSDALVAHEVHELLGVNVSQLRWVSAAALYYAFGVGEIGTKSKTQITHDEKLDIVMRHGDLAVSALCLIPAGYANSSHWAVRKTTLAGIMFTLNRQPEIAEGFWPLAITDDGLSIGDPRKTLNKYLSGITVGGNQAMLGNKKFAGDVNLMKAMALSWSAFVSRKPLRILRTGIDGKVASFKRCGEFRAA